MKHFKAITTSVAVLAAAIMLAVSWPAAARADDQGMPSTMRAATNLPSIVNLSKGSNQTSVVSIRQGKGLALSWVFNSASTSNTANAAIWIRPSVDGTNYDTVHTWQWIAPANGTTDQVTTTNWSAATLSGYVSLNLATMTNYNADTGTLTNKGVMWNFPNN